MRPSHAMPAERQGHQIARTGQRHEICLMRPDRARCRRQELSEMYIGRADDPENPSHAMAHEAATVLGTGSRNPSGPAAKSPRQKAGHMAALDPITTFSNAASCFQGAVHTCVGCFHHRKKISPRRHGDHGAGDSRHAPKWSHGRRKRSARSAIIAAATPSTIELSHAAASAPREAQ
jgi:hypothetical protein